ncbi:hypothetical protein [Helicobacter pylori]|uniref:hypothetical protein n=1 Tax=Helicobacter pylori TaxID=210 RepID=UPI00165C19AE|nr:hypothetical protein [Helicobacter pylori]MBH0235696.1 hypothetical protein [Helicobacter pylori]MBH0251758.1 hypothetical protein [Helicobacter pylori]MBH0270976.1 hypothetical protein [Helicobacter pylori]
MKKDRKKKQKYSNITDLTIMGSTAEESALHASANREHFSAFDRLEEISKRKINPNYIKQNINQQAGYSAEIKEQARVNVHNILAGKRERIVQYDDLSSGQKAQVKKFFPNHATPSKNHEIVDYVSVDEKGNVIPSTAVQSKFVGRNGEECFKKLLSKDYEKYFENGANMKIARKNHYGDFQRAVNTRIKSLESQIAKQKGLGDFQKAAHLEEKLQKCKTIKAHTRPASTTKREAIEARLNPNLSTAKDVASVSHRAGMNAMQIGGVVSLITNIYECIANGKDPEKAIKHTAIATLKGGALSYVSAFASSSLGGLMQSSANKIIQSLGKGSAPAMIVGACVANATVLTRYFSGKIDGKELLKKQLGKANTTLVSSGAMAFAGQALIPIPVVGALIGGFVGAVLSETCFNALLKAREEAKLARQRRIEIEKECREIIKLLEIYQNQFKEVFERYFHETTKFFNQSFDELWRASYTGDADLGIGINNKIQERLGQKPLFNNTQEFLELMNNGGKIEI